MFQTNVKVCRYIFSFKFDHSCFVCSI